MSAKIKTILVPVDFTANSHLAIEKSIKFYGDQQTSIFLLYVQVLSRSNLPGILVSCLHRYFGHANLYQHRNAGAKLDALEDAIHQIDPRRKVCKLIQTGDNIEVAIAEIARKICADLIVVAKHSHHSLFPCLNTVVGSRLARRSGVPVLTSKPGSRSQSFKGVVMTVGESFPSKKVEIIQELSRQHELDVRLVAFTDSVHHHQHGRQAVLDTISLIKGMLSMPVRLDVIEGGSKAKALLKYCIRVNADILIVEPFSETVIPGLLNRHMSDLIPATSKTQIVAVTQP